MRTVLFRVATFVACVSFLFLVSSSTAFAEPQFDGNCGASGCHSTTTTRQDTSPTSQTAQAGQTVTFASNVTGAGNITFTVFSGRVTSGEFTQDLTAIPGTANAGHTLVVTPTNPAAWTTQTGDGGFTYYTSNPNDTASTFTKSFSFVIPAGTQNDTYLLRIGAAGIGASPSPSRWAEFTDISLTVGSVPEPATLMMLCGGALVGLICWRGRKHLAAK